MDQQYPGVAEGEASGCGKMGGELHWQSQTSVSKLVAFLGTVQNLQKSSEEATADLGKRIQDLVAGVVGLQARSPSTMPRSRVALFRGPVKMYAGRSQVPANPKKPNQRSGDLDVATAPVLGWTLCQDPQDLRVKCENIERASIFHKRRHQKACGPDECQGRRIQGCKCAWRTEADGSYHWSRRSYRQGGCWCPAWHRRDGTKGDAATARGRQA